MSNRTEKAAKNIICKYLYNIIHILLSFILRTSFIYTIGITYLGVNGLYSNILGLLSLSELGINTGINFSLYRHIANNDREKIKSLMRLYKYIYRTISVIVTVVGILLIPFLNSIIRDSGGLAHNELIVYYIIFLFNTASSYLISYKYSLVSADQNGFIITKFDITFELITIALQIAVLHIYKNFLLYLLVQAAVGIVKKIYLSAYINRIYPDLKDKRVLPVSREEKRELFDNVRGTFIHKIGDVAVHQTDNIIMSAFINLVTVGLISNYNLVLDGIRLFTNAVFDNLVAGYGNFIASESLERQENLLFLSQFLSFFIYGFSSVCLMILIQPFVRVWIGADNMVDDLTIFLLTFDTFFQGERVMLNNYKMAAGIFLQDRWVAVLRAAANIILSIWLVHMIGLPGIFVGTLLQGLIGNVCMPLVVYKYVLHKSPIQYYLKSFSYLGCVVIIYVFLQFILLQRVAITSIYQFIFLMFGVAGFVLGTMTVFFWKNRYFIQIRGMLIKLKNRTPGRKMEDERN